MNGYRITGLTADAMEAEALRRLPEIQRELDDDEPNARALAAGFQAGASWASTELPAQLIGAGLNVQCDQFRGADG